MGCASAGEERVSDAPVNSPEVVALGTAKLPPTVAATGQRAAVQYSVLAQHPPSADRPYPV